MELGTLPPLVLALALVNPDILTKMHWLPAGNYRLALLHQRHLRGEDDSRREDGV